MSSLVIGREGGAPVALHYDDHGAGVPVVLVHGWPLSATSWERQTAALVASGRRVVAYDRRGFGGSSRPASGYDYDTLADDLHKVLTHLNLRQVALVGFGMGAGEVIRYLHAYGARRVSCAVLIAPLPPAGAAAVADRLGAALATDRAAALRTFLADLCNVDRLGGRVGSDVMRLGWSVAARASASALRACVAAWRTDLTKELPGIDVPTLIVHGDADRLSPLAAAALPLRAAVKRSRLVVVDGGPHGLIWTHADQVNDAVLRFLAAPASTTRQSEE